MISLRKRYIKRKEKNLKALDISKIFLIFYKDKTSLTSNHKLKQKFNNFMINKLPSGGVLIESTLEEVKSLGTYLREIPLDLAAIRIKERWYTGALIKKKRFERPNEKLLALILKRQENLKR